MSDYLLDLLDNLKDLPNRILLKKIVNDSLYKKTINANEIVYNSLYFRYYNQPASNYPEKIGNGEFMLLTINFSNNLTEDNKPIEGDPEHKIGYGVQFALDVQYAVIYFRSFIWHLQKYDKWRIINTSESPI